ncbi:MAG: GNAT family N-acetyltransferase [Desulfobacteraceae bacterium]|nr:GNAT family N-acetyltransferase [Desulfobacteraceae bacterium]
MIKIRNYRDGDHKALWLIFFNTIRNINVCDYNQEQVEAWAPSEYNETKWLTRMNGINPFVAEIENNIVGYADIQNDGYIDHFFCHHDWQGKGVGSLLMGEIHNKANSQKIERLYSEVSVTARPFFLKKDFKVVQKQQVNINGQALTNFFMEKHLKHC